MISTLVSWLKSEYSCMSVKFSPFDPNRVAVACCDNFGIVGKGKLMILNIVPDQPMEVFFIFFFIFIITRSLESLKSMMRYLIAHGLRVMGTSFSVAVEMERCVCGMLALGRFYSRSMNIRVRYRVSTAIHGRRSCSWVLVWMELHVYGIW